VLTYRRGSASGSATVRTARRPPAAAPPPEVASATGPSGALPQRFTGAFAGADIVARGNVTIIVAEQECWMEIRTAESVVRLTQRDGCRPGGRSR
jgi:hypothetical protein